MSKYSRIKEFLTDKSEALSVAQIAEETNLSIESVVHTLNNSEHAEEFVSDVRGRYKIRPLQTEEA